MKNVEMNKIFTPDVYVSPKMVIEVGADEISVSPTHTAGYALRFPRLIKFRDDKNPEDATNVSEIEKCIKIKGKIKMAMKAISDIINSKKMSRDYRCSHEFQAYGNKLAEDLGDKKHRALYIKLAKTEDRNLLEEARESVLSSKKATTKGRLFMWKLGQLKKEREERKNLEVGTGYKRTLKSNPKNGLRIGTSILR